MKLRSRPQSLMTEINITPLTDVILVLLIIFIVATPLISQNQIEVKLPEASKENPIKNEQQYFITITGEGVVYFDNKVYTTQELKKKINSILGKDSDSKFIVAADKSCRFQEVVKIIDLLKQLGARSLNIATKADN